MTYSLNPSHPPGAPRLSPRRRKLIATVIIVSVLAILALGVYVNRPPEYTPQQWQFAMNGLKRYVGRVAFRSYGLDSTSASVDFLLSERKWCTAVISVRTDTFGIVACFAGELDFPELFFEVGGPTETEPELILRGAALQRYDSLLAKDSCWLFFDSVPYWGDAGLKAFWVNTAFNPKEEWGGFRSTLLPELENK